MQTARHPSKETVWNERTSGPREELCRTPTSKEGGRSEGDSLDDQCEATDTTRRDLMTKSSRSMKTEEISGFGHFSVCERTRM